VKTKFKDGQLHLDHVKACFARLPPNAPETQLMRPYVHLLTAETVDGEQLARSLGHGHHSADWGPCLL
jgi:hypothetical protein